MHGNVWEWVEDCVHNNYNGAPVDGSAWIKDECPLRVNRSGSWYSSPERLRSARRDGNTPDYRDATLGFRVGRTLTP